MRILYLSQYFPPEAGATQARAYEFSKYLVNHGHSVTVITEIPNHPSGIVSPEYRRGYLHQEFMEGIDVIRVWVRAVPRKNATNRVIFYISYMINAIIAGSLTRRNSYDLVYASSPPLFVGASALALSSIKKIPLIFEVRDLWPESAIALGELSNPMLISMAKRLENACYKKAISIVVVTQGIYDRLVQRSIPSAKLILIPNGANTDVYKFQDEGRQRIRNQYHLDNKFVVIYAGLLGIAQGLETGVEAAKLLANDPSIHFIFLGAGSQKESLVRSIGAHQIENITIIPEKPSNQVPDYLSSADVAWIPLRDHSLFEGALPSKLFDAWACSRPVICGIRGEAKNLVENVKGGVSIEPEKPSQLAEKIKELMQSPANCLEMGTNGREFTEKHHSRDRLSRQLLDHLEVTVSEK